VVVDSSHYAERCQAAARAGLTNHPDIVSPRRGRVIPRQESFFRARGKRW
jgi:hypothetical protein